MDGQREILIVGRDVSSNAFPSEFCGLATIMWTLKSECLGMNPSFAAALLLRIHFLLCEMNIITASTSELPARTSGGN